MTLFDRPCAWPRVFLPQAVHVSSCFILSCIHFQLTVNVPITSNHNLPIARVWGHHWFFYACHSRSAQPNGTKLVKTKFLPPGSRQYMRLTVHHLLHHVASCRENEEDREGPHQHTAPRCLAGQSVTPRSHALGKPRRNSKASSWHLPWRTWKLCAGKLRATRGCPRFPRSPVPLARPHYRQWQYYSTCVGTGKRRKWQGASQYAIMVAPLAPKKLLSRLWHVLALLQPLTLNGRTLRRPLWAQIMLCKTSFRHWLGGRGAFLCLRFSGFRTLRRTKSIEIVLYALCKTSEECGNHVINFLRRGHERNYLQWGVPSDAAVGEDANGRRWCRSVQGGCSR